MVSLNSNKSLTKTQCLEVVNEAMIKLWTHISPWVLPTSGPTVSVRISFIRVHNSIYKSSNRLLQHEFGKSTDCSNVSTVLVCFGFSLLFGIKLNSPHAGDESSTTGGLEGWLRALVALTEDQGWIPSTLMLSCNICNSTSRVSAVLFWPPHAPRTCVMYR